MKITINILLTLLMFQSYAQNLVPNPSFEDFNSCPISDSQISALLNWYSPTQGSPDYFHSCNAGVFVGVPLNFPGSQLAQTGEGYIGINVAYGIPAIDFREYAQVQLNSALTGGTDYFVSFNVSLSDTSNLATDDIGLFFSNDSLVDFNTFQSLSVTPQIENTQGNILSDPTIWYNISGNYTALGGEEYITIGNFKDASNTTTSIVYVNQLDSSGYFSYYYIDDVCITLDSLGCQSSLGVNEMNISSKKELVKIVDSMGRITANKPNSLLIYIYSDGSTKKVFRVE